MPRTYKPKCDSRGYKRYTDESLRNAIDQIKTQKISLRKASRTFGIPLGTLSHKVNKLHSKNPGRPPAFTKEEENSFVKHIQVVGEWGFPFDMFDIRIMARNYLTTIGRNVPQFKNNFPSNDWAKSFYKRHITKLTIRMCQNIKRSRSSVSVDDVNSFFDNLSHTLNINNDEPIVPASHIFNYDETCLADDPGVKRCFYKRGIKYAERIKDSSKTSTSIMFCGSAAGVMLPCYVVYKAENLWSTWTTGGPKGTRYNRSRSGWFDACTFTDWFLTLFIPHVKDLPGKKVIIGDNLSSHFTSVVLSKAEEYNISFVCLPSNSTHMMQPLDVAFYRPLKQKWRAIMDEWKACGNKSRTLSKDLFPSLLTKLYRKLYPDGLQLCQNIKSGFKKSGIYPYDPSQVLERLPDYSNENELQVKEAVSDVVVNMLKRMRGVEADGEKQNRKRRKRITVSPGKSIGVTDYDGNSVSSSGDENEISTGSTEAFIAENGKNFSIGDFVVVRYEGSHFPGTVTSLEYNGALVNVLTKCKGQGWKWPEVKDEVVYLWADIKNTIKESNVKPINNRGVYKIIDEGLETEWGA